MLLYLLRHADADTVAATDDARFLSEKGEAQAEKVGRFCEAHDLRPELILTSPVRRAHDTAVAVADRLRAELLVAGWLACGMTPETAFEELHDYLKFSAVMIVGHEPDFSHFIAHSLGIEDHAQLNIRKASLTLLEFRALRSGAATLHFSIPCKLM